MFLQQVSRRHIVVDIASNPDAFPAAAVHDEGPPPRGIRDLLDVVPAQEPGATHRRPMGDACVIDYHPAAVGAYGVPRCCKLQEEREQGVLKASGAGPQEDEGSKEDGENLERQHEAGRSRP